MRDIISIVLDIMTTSKQQNCLESMFFQHDLVLLGKAF